MPLLPDKNECCGCAACIDVCKKNAISLLEDINGYYYPSIDNYKCTDCRACENSCHILHTDEIQRNDAKKVQPFAAWSTNESLIKNSASGGIFAQMAYDLLGQANTYVYGASMMPNNTVRHIEINSREDIYKLQNSKYQQCISTGIYKRVKQRLKEGAQVLFSGIPCQIAALYRYLGKLSSTENLSTIEIICHGVPTNELSKLGIKLQKAKQIVYYRTKERGWTGAGNRLTYKMPDETLHTIRSNSKDFVFRSYLSFSFSRKNCYDCKYACINRISDITIGDFWGWEKSERSEEYKNYMGTSIVLPNSPKGLHMIQNSPQLHYVEVSWKDILPMNQNLFMPTNKYLYLGHDKISKLRKLPLFLQKFIYQNGFTIIRIDLHYKRILEWGFRKRIKAAYKEIDKKIEETLKYLKS